MSRIYTYKTILLLFILLSQASVAGNMYEQANFDVEERYVPFGDESLLYADDMTDSSPFDDGSEIGMFREEMSLLRANDPNEEDPDLGLVPIEDAPPALAIIFMITYGIYVVKRRKTNNAGTM